MTNLFKETDSANLFSMHSDSDPLLVAGGNQEIESKSGVRRIILMDLNVALSSNFKEMRNHNFETFIKEVETFRDWMVDLLRPEYVILITARNIKWGVPTLNRINELTNWIPNEAIFNDTGISGSEAPLVKKKQVLEKIIPRHGDDLQKYYAIESNPRTREMYSSIGINAYDCERDGAWDRLPF